MDQIVTLTKKKEEKESSEKYKRILRIYIIPLCSVLVFMGIVLFLIIPKVTQLFSQLEEIESINIEIEKRDTKIQAIQKLAGIQSEIEQDLQVIDSIAPSGNTAVVLFSNKIYDMAREHSLDVLSQSTSDSRVGSVSTSQEGVFGGSPIRLLEVPVSFELLGDLESINSFIADLSAIDDFVVISDFVLSGSPDGGWQFDLTFSKYQFDEDESLSASEYQLVSPSSILDEDIKNYIEDKRYSF